MLSYEKRQEALLRAFGVVHAHDPETGIFMLAPDRLGFGVLCQPLTGFGETTQDSLNALLNTQFPPDTIVQFVLYASPDCEDVLHSFRVLRQQEQDEMLQGLSNARVEYLRQLTKRPIGATAGAKLRQMQLMITVSLPHGVKAPSSEELIQLSELSQSFRSQVKNCGFAAEMLTPAMYIRFMESVLNHSEEAGWRGTPWTPYDDGELICNQLLDKTTSLDAERRMVRLGEDALVRVMSPKHYPTHVYPGMAMKYVGDLMKGSRALREPTLITVNIMYPKQDAIRGKMTRDHAWATRNADGPLAKYVQDYALQKQSLDVAVDAMGEGDQIVYAYIGVAVIAEDADRLIQATTEVKGSFRELGFKLQDDAFFVLPLFLQLLPFGAAEDMKKSLSRYKTLPTRYVVPLLPVVASWRGTWSPMLTLIGRDGQLMRVSPYDSDGNYNFLICAQSGMGKSFLANSLTVNFLSIGGRAWIIDKGFSYKQICELLDGQYIEFTNEQQFCMNPFTNVIDFEEEADILAGIIGVMVAPSQGLSDRQRAAVKQVMSEVWAEMGHDTTYDALADRFISSEDVRIKDIGHQLFSFTSKGEFGRWFNGVNTVNMENRLVVLELQQLASRGHLMRVVLMVVMNQIQQSMDRLPRDMKKLLLIDEAFGLLSHDDTRDFMVTFYRQIRKFNGCAGLITQSVNDLYANAGALAMVENSSSMWLLGQKPESIAQVKRENRLEMGEAGFSALASVHTRKGEYSEILCRNAFGMGIGRLVVSDEEKLLFSTDANDVMAIRQYRTKGLGLIESVQSVLRDRGHAAESKKAALA